MISGGMAGLAGILEAIEPARPDQPRLSLGLRLHRDHRLVPRPAASARRLPRGPDPRRHLCRRPGRADGGACAGGDRRHLPGDDAVLHSGERHSRPLSPARRSRRAARREPRRAAGVNLDFVIDALVTVIGVTTPILLAATGELVVEKSGVLNLGVEGMMLIGAVTGFAVTLNYGDASRRLGAVGRRHRGGARGRGLLDAVRRSGADARLQPGRDRPRAGDLRHRPLVADRRELRRHGDRAVQSGLSRLARRPTRSGGSCSATARSSISR